MHEEMTTTGFTLEGYQIVQTLGVVRGVTVRSRSLFGTIGAKFETLLGGQISSSRRSASGRDPTPSTSSWLTPNILVPTQSSVCDTTPRRSCLG